MSIVSLDGKEYRLGKLNALRQFHVARRMSAFYVALLESALKLREQLPNGDTDNTDLRSIVANVNLVKLAETSTPIVDVISKMSDADVDYVIKTCLSAVEYHQSENMWAPMMVGEQFNFDLTMVTMIGLTAAVIQQDIAGFFPTGPPESASALK